MNPNHEALKAAAIAAVDNLASDTSVDLETSKDSLEEVRDEINSRLDGIRADISREDRALEEED